MGIREIPAKKISTCDACGTSKEGPPPPDWIGLHVKASALDHRTAVADASVNRLFCRSCGVAVTKAVNETIRALADKEA